MTRFEDGPCKRAILHLQRTPIMLRVTMVFHHGNGERTGFGEWDGQPTFDALDQLDDVPKPEEKIFVYRLKDHSGVRFVDGRDKKTGKRWGRSERIATYALYPTQPGDEILRDTAKWQQWCTELQASETKHV